MTIDWTKRSSEKARMRVEIKRFLRKNNFKTDLETIDLVITQAELMAENLI